jgi:DNA-binding NtrC family response regulator
VSPEALELLTQYRWPGNVRELQNIIERGVILARGEITVRELPREILEQNPPAEAGEGILKYREKETIWKTLQQYKGNRKQTAEALGISLRTLQYRIKELGLQVKEE